MSGADQSQHLLRMVDGILASKSLSRSDIAAIAFEAGPGSFTSLRVSCSVGQGLAFGLDVPLVPVGTLEALAVQAVGQSVRGRHLVLAAIDARLGEAYASLVAVECEDEEPLGRPLLLCAPRVVGIDALPGSIEVPSPAPGSLILAGDLSYEGYSLRAALERRFNCPVTALGNTSGLRADVIGSIARLRLAETTGWDAAAAMPLYIRDKVALNRDEQESLRRMRLGTARTPDRA